MTIVSASGTTRSRRSRFAPAGIIILLAVLLASAAAFTVPAWAGSKPAPQKGVGPPPVSAEELDLQRRVLELAATLKAPCCPNLTVAQHDSPTTLAMKRDIHDMLKAGKGRGEIVAALKAKYGGNITGSVISTNRKVILWSGGILASLLVVGIIARFMWTHEKEPVHLDQGHWMEEDASHKGPEPARRAS
jgi:cytochrome c-type biogenesis protein CcmH/NrfF